MPFLVSSAATRARLVVTRWLAQIGLKEESFLVVLAVLIGLVTALAAVGFHELIRLIIDLLYQRVGEKRLYGNGIFMLAVWPAVGGLTVGILTHYVFRTRAGHGIVDVMESVVRTSGFIKPISAIEKILTSAVTIGTGGAVGAEGPIVQIGAAISSGTGQLFRLPRHHMPALIGCGAAAGISAIFNSPMGGMLFALEVILQDFSIRNITPVIVASVISNVATGYIFQHMLGEQFRAIFVLGNLPTFEMNWLQLQNYIILGVICGIVGVGLTRLMLFFEKCFHRLPLSPVIKPALGGLIVGVMGVLYVMIFGWWLTHTHKPVPFSVYPMPAFFSDGYGFIQLMLHPAFYQSWPSIAYLLLLMSALIVAKLLGASITVTSGGGGGLIAPALFLGALVGGGMGVAMRSIALFSIEGVHPETYALIGMGAALAAIVHAPLASILILLELTRDSDVVLPAMLATIIATGVARFLFADSVYTLVLRLRGIRVGAVADATLLHRLLVEQVPIIPAVAIEEQEPFQNLLDLMGRLGATDFVVTDHGGNYQGMVVAEDIKTALLEREAVPLLVAEELMRPDIQLVKTTDDLAKTLDSFTRNDVSHLPVTLPDTPGKVIGLISRSALMRHYQQAVRGE